MCGWSEILQAFIILSLSTCYAPFVSVIYTDMLVVKQAFYWGYEPKHSWLVSDRHGARKSLHFLYLFFECYPVLIGEYPIITKQGSLQYNILINNCKITISTKLFLFSLKLQNYCQECFPF